ncbi:MAG: GNAT family N-acetyltransferase [Hyphomicrobiaceae bacterium]|nr:GNAT family N-acetyltransferase [Hyphomicrobiaceae bacterium]
MSFVIETLTGAALERALPALARLRLKVFREWPYLYDGTTSYEQRYLADFTRCEGSLIVAARDDEDVIGAATAAPLRGHTAAFAKLFEAHGYDPDELFYFGESVLLREYRGRGIGHAFFDWREEHARSSTGSKGPYRYTTFCAVVRPDDHPLKPRDYRPLDPFWSKRDYRMVEGLVGKLSWKDIDQAGETEKPMQFWIKPLE